jgi:mannose-6-phosphate isomerase-like protein (cupin superfamily)
MKIRRVTTGHNAHGKAIVASDTEVDGTTLTQLAGAEFHRLWGADRPPHFPDDGAQPEGRDYFPPLGGFRFMMFTVAPHSTSRRAAVDPQALAAEMEAKLPGLAPYMEPNNPGMHTTDSIDFEYIVTGEVWLDLDDGAAVRLRAGDTVVQNGTRHRWRNEGSEPCRIVVFIVGTHRDPSGIDVARASV